MVAPNWANNTVFTGDNLHIMRGMNSESVDLIYLDPPFNSKRDYAAPIGSQAAGAEFSDTWTLRDVDAEWINLIEDKHPALHRVLLAAMTDSDKSYLAYMAARLLEAHRVLGSSGSLFLHCDPTMSHYLKLLLDAIFGRSRFRNELVWCYTGPSNTKRWFPRKHDTIFWFAKGDEWTFDHDTIRVPYVKLQTGKTSGIFKQEATLDSRGKVPEDWWPDCSPVGRIANERVGYPTQKPLSLLSRIIQAATPPPAALCSTHSAAAPPQWSPLTTSAANGSASTYRRRQRSLSCSASSSGRECSATSSTAPTFRSAPIWATCRGTTAVRTARRCTGSRAGTAPGAASTSCPRTSLSITSSPRARAAPTTSATCNCCADTATR